MTAVTVDLDDLEKVVMATGAIKTIEQALNTRRHDPFVPPESAYTDAHKRLASAMLNAKRSTADTVVKFDEPLTDEEGKALQRAAKEKTKLETPSGQVRTDLFLIATQQKIPDEGEVMSVWDRLAAKGCIVMGSVVNGVLWAGADRITDAMVDHGGYAIKITDRGREKLLQVAS